jgi:hypothetical protein
VEGSRVFSANPDPGMMMRTVAALQQDSGAQEKLQALQGCAAAQQQQQQQQQQQLAGSIAKLAAAGCVHDDSICSGQAGQNTIMCAATASAADTSFGSCSSAGLSAAMTQLPADTFVPWFNSDLTAAATAAAPAAPAAVFVQTPCGATESFTAACDPGASLLSSATAACSFDSNWTTGNVLPLSTPDKLLMPAAVCTYMSTSDYQDWQHQGQIQVQEPVAFVAGGTAHLQQLQQLQQQWQVPTGLVSSSMPAAAAADSMQLLPAASSALFGCYLHEASPTASNVFATADAAAGVMVGAQVQLQGSADVAAIDMAINQQLLKLIALRRGLAAKADHSSSSFAAAAAAEAALEMQSCVASGPAAAGLASPSAAATAGFQPQQQVSADADAVHVPRLILAAQAALRAADCASAAANCSFAGQQMPAGMQQPGLQSAVQQQQQQQQPIICGAANGYSGANVGAVAAGIGGIITTTPSQVGGSSLGGSLVGALPQQLVDPAGQLNLVQQQLQALPQQELSLQEQLSALKF